MRLLLALAIAFCGLSLSPAWAQVDSREGIVLQNQIMELRRDVQALSGGRATPPSYSGSMLGGQGSAPAASQGNGEILTQLLSRVERMEDQIRQINGRLDEMGNAQQRLGDDLTKQIADMKFRLDNTGGQAAPPPAANSNQAPAVLGTVPVKESPAQAGGKRSVDAALQDGNAALARRDYAEAEAAAKEVLALPKGSPRGYDAQFLLAQAKAGQKDYASAALAYNDAFTRSKQGVHAQDSLLGLASSLNALNQKSSACAALDQLHAQFPTLRTDLAPRVAALHTSAGCH